MKTIFPYFAFVASILFFHGCTESNFETPDPDVGYDYFPLEVGKFRIYQVDSIIYDPILGGTQIDTFSSQIREVIAEAFTDNTGEVVYRVERYRRPDAQASWTPDKVIVLSKDKTRAFWMEDNLRFIKMVFPVAVGKQWDGHVFFNPNIIVPVAGESIELFKDWSYEITAVGERYEGNGLEFPDVAEVSLADNENLIELRRATEKYAKGIGLVYREWYILDTQCKVCCNGEFGPCEALAWGEKAEKGFILKQSLLAFN